jgi:subtilase family serine protease
LYRTEVATIALPQATKQLSHETLNSPVTDLPTVPTITMASHQGAILLKVADLSISVTASPTPVLLGGNITYTVTVTNNGPSTATGLSVSGLSGCALASTSILSGGTAGCTVSVPANAVGSITQTVGVSGTEVDPSLSNNTASVSTTVTAPDLTPTAMSASKSGSRVNVSDTVRNQGNANAGPFTVKYYLSTDTALSSDDLALATASGGTTPCVRSVTALNLGVSSSISNKSCYRPAGVVTGTRYYVLAVDDADKQVIESNEGNNVRATTGTMKW